MRKIMLVMVCAVAATIAGNAAAQELDDTLEFEIPYYIAEDGSVDWDLVKEWSEIVDTFVDEEGVEKNVYVDFFQEIMWDEPSQASLILGEGDRTVYITPIHILWDYEGGGGGDFKVGEGELAYYGSCPGTNCRKWVNTIGDCPENVSRIEALGSTPYANDYCDGGYIGQFRDIDDGDTWETAEDESCSQFFLLWTYHLEEASEVSDHDYSHITYPRMARFVYNIGRSQHIVEIWCNDIPE